MSTGARTSVAVFAAVFAASALYTFTRPKVYEATATWTLPPPVYTMWIGRDEPPPERYQPILEFVQSTALVERVVANIDDELAQVLLLHRSSDSSADAGLAEILTRGRNVGRVPLSHVVACSFRHADPIIAARVANVFADQAIAWAMEYCATDYVSRTAAAAAQVEAQQLQIELLANRLDEIDALPPHSTIGDRPANHVRQEVEASLARAKDDLLRREFEVLQAARPGHDETRSIRRLDPAVPPAPGDHVSPRHLLHLGIGAALGLAAATAPGRLRRRG